MDSSIQIDYRCSCGKLLFRGLVFRSSVEVKCSRCNRMNFFEGLGTVKNPNRIIILTNAEGKIIKTSSSVELSLGYSPEELVGENISQIFADKKMIKADQIFSQKIAGRKYLRLDGICRDKKKKKIPVSICYRHLLHNGGELFLRIIDVIPEMQKKLISDAKFDFAYFCDVVTETDDEGNILYLDKNLKSITGFEPEDLIGLKVDDLLFGNEKDMRSKNYKMLRAQKKSYRTLPGYKVKGKNGEVFDQEVYCTPFYDDAGNFIGFRNMHWLKKCKTENK